MRDVGGMWEVRGQFWFSWFLSSLCGFQEHLIRVVRFGWLKPLPAELSHWSPVFTVLMTAFESAL